jgi:PAS domain S-box-containing protein
MDDASKTQLEFFQATLDNLNDAILIINREGKVVYTNHRFEECFKSLVDDIGEWTFERMKSELDVYDLNGHFLSPTQWPFARIMKGEKIFQEKLKVILKSASNVTLVLQVSGGPVKYANHQQPYFLISLLDITHHETNYRLLQEKEQRIKTEKKLMESEEMLNIFIQHAPAALAMFDREMRYIAASRRWLDDNKVSLDEIIGAIHYDIVPDISEEWKEIHRRGLNGESIRNDDDKFVRQNGSVLFLKWEVRPWFNAEKEVGGIILITEDITARKQNERRLIESEKRFANIFYDSPIPIAITRLVDGEIILANPSVTAFFGFTQAELIGNTTVKMGFWADVTIRLKFIEMIQKHHRVTDMETFVYLKSGEKRDVLMWGELIEYYGEECILLEIIDITEKKINEEKIRLQNEKVKAILHSLPDKLFIHDADGTFQEAYTTNPDGYIEPKENFIGKKLSDVFPPEIAALNLTYLKECLQRREPVSHEFSTDYKGTFSTFEVRIVPFMDNLAIRFVRDITKSKENEKKILELNSSLERRIAERTNELQSNQDKLMLSQKIAQMGVWEFNTQNDQVKWSEETYKIFDRSPEKGPFSFKEFLDSIYPEDREKFANSSYSMANGENIITHILRHYTDKGNLKWIKYYIKGVATEGEVTQFMGTLLDITAEREVQRRLEEAVHEAEEANKAKSIFLANMSHEIRTPLNSIIGFSELLNHTIKDDKKRSQIASIRNSGRSLLKIINDILDLSKIEADKMVVEREAINVFQVVTDVCSIFEPNIAEKNLQLTIESDIVDDMPLLLDETRLRQILFNLVGNAIKFTFRGGISVGIHHEEKEEKTVDLKISIGDTGMGISDDQLEAIFEPFVQQKGQAHKSFGGTGLGLTISRRMAEAMGGEISVKSKLNEGSVFTLLLKDITKADCIPVKTEKSFYDYAEIRFEESTILIVDDIEDNRRLLRDTLKHTGARLLEADNGLDAVRIATEELPDIILMDKRMPMMDGMESCKALKGNPLTADIICIGVSATMRLGKSGSDSLYTFNDNLIKPISLEKLFEILLQYLHNTSQPSQTVLSESETMSAKAPEWSDALKQYAKDLLIPLYHQVMGTQLMDDMEDFGRRLTEAGRQFENKKLIDTGNRIMEYAEQFEVEKLTRTLREFKQMLNEEL